MCYTRITAQKTKPHFSNNKIILPEQNNNTTTPFTTMAIDIEWAKSLKGLSMKVPDNWWPGYTDQILHDGKIDSFDPLTQKWNLLLDSNDDDDLYLMAYEALSVCTLTTNRLPFTSSNFLISLFL